ncbi:ATP-binding protein [Parasphingorhabdus sp.]|uniref:ATP-binding protein n=1 Tax=Parasphingorhabdus sp. TaxID=2709688 RepID=UPI0035930CDA
MADDSQASGGARAEEFRKELGPLAVAVETALMPKIFTDGTAPDHPVIFANDAFLRLTGSTREEILDKPLSQFLVDGPGPDILSSLDKMMTHGGCAIWKMRRHRLNDDPDGKRQFLAAVQISPVRNGDDVICQNYLSFVELGDHDDRISEFAGQIDQSQTSQMREMYDSAPGFIAVTAGPEHRFTFVNESYKRFVRKDDIEGRTVAEVLPEVVDQGFIDLLDQVYRSGEPYVGEGMGIGIFSPTSGKVEIRYRDFVYQPIRDADNKVIGLFCEGYDVTEQRETAERLSALQTEMIFVSRVNAMGTMAATLAHELNQPISAIANYTAGMMRLIEPSDKNADRLTQAVEGIEQASQNAAEIIQSLREMTKKRVPVRAPFNLKSAIDECVRLVNAAVPPQVNIVDDVPGDLTMTADRVQIQQVIINLLRNGCDAVLESERQIVSIEAKDQGTELLVSVSDTGPGLSADTESGIFTWSTSAKESGMGLGLSICRTIVEAHSGLIALAESSPQGSTFCFSIPQSDQPGAARPRPN